MKNRDKILGGLVFTAVMQASVGLAQAADFSVGVVVSSTGSGAVLGIPYKNVFESLPNQIAGQPVKYIVLNDESDVTTGVRNAKKLVEESNVDILIGSNSVPVTQALMRVAAEYKTPLISLGPIDFDAKKDPWTFSIPQPIPLMMGAVLEDMKKNGVKKVGYIGFADAWGDSVYKAVAEQKIIDGLEITTDERYQRNDVSIIAQTLKIMRTQPDAVVVGASGASGALPHISLRDKGYQGMIYNTHGSVSQDFIRIGGKQVADAIAPAGPYLFASQLAESNPVKANATKYFEMYDAAYGKEARSPFAGYAYDAYLLLEAVLPKVAAAAEPGTEAFRAKLRDSLEQDVKEVVGTQGVYTMTETDHNGLDERARILVQVKDQKWRVKAD